MFIQQFLSCLTFQNSTWIYWFALVKIKLVLCCDELNPRKKFIRRHWIKMTWTEKGRKQRDKVRVLLWLKEDMTSFINGRIVKEKTKVSNRWVSLSMSLGPILHPAQLTFYTGACIVASLHRVWSWFPPTANSCHYTCALERHVGKKQRRVSAQTFYLLAILVIQKAIGRLTGKYLV